MSDRGITYKFTYKFFLYREIPAVWVVCGLVFINWQGLNCCWALRWIYGLKLRVWHACVEYDTHDWYIEYLFIIFLSSLMASTSDSDPESDDNTLEYVFSSNEGWKLAHYVLRPQLPYDPHDAQLEGICKAIDGVDIMVLTATGSGKTEYFTMYMLLMWSLAVSPELIGPTKKTVPQNPAIVIVFPTNGVEEGMVHGKLIVFTRLTDVEHKKLSLNLMGCKLSPLMQTLFKLLGCGVKTSG